MKIVLLAHNLSVGGGLTIGERVTSILPRLLPEHQFLVSCPSGKVYLEAASMTNVEVLRLPRRGLLRRLIWERVALRQSIRSFEPDWLFGLGNLAYEGWSGRQSVLLHDSHLLYPAETFGKVSRGYRFKKWVLKLAFRRSLAITDRVYTQTETIRRRLHNQFGLSLKQIHLFPPAYEKRNESIVTVPSALAAGSGDLKLLYVSAPWGHKNHNILIDTFLNHREQLAGVRCFITVDPGMNDLGRSIIEMIKANGLGEQIITLGHLSPAEVQAAYRASDALIFPSILETVGLPLIEAMEHGLPILASDLDFAHEMCGDAACFFNPHSVDDVARCVIRVRDDPAYRATLSQRSTDQFQNFVQSWDDVLEKVIRVEGLPFENFG